MFFTLSHMSGQLYSGDTNTRAHEDTFEMLVNFLVQKRTNPLSIPVKGQSKTALSGIPSEF